MRPIDYLTEEQVKLVRSYQRCIRRGITPSTEEREARAYYNKIAYHHGNAKESQDNYRLSAKGQRVRKKVWKSDTYKATQKRYLESPKGRATRAAYYRRRKAAKASASVD